MKNNAVSNLMLLITAFIWGSAFVGQRAGMENLEPIIFNSLRAFLGAFSLLFLIIIFKIKKGPNLSMNKWEERRYLFKAGILCGIVLTLASAVQQVGMVYTTASKAGFISSLYIILVPLLAVLLGRKVPKTLWCGIVLGAFGLYFLCAGEGLSSVGFGDIMVMISAFLFAVHILIIDHFAPKVDSVKLSCIQFFVVGLVCLAPGLLYEHPTVDAVLACKWSLLYTGVMSSAVAYTLQIMGQKNTDPALASLIMSFESVFSVIAGVLVLHESLAGREILGCVLMFIAVLVAQAKCNPSAGELCDFTKSDR